MIWTIGLPKRIIDGVIQEAHDSDVKLAIWFPLWGIGSAVFYYGLLIVAPFRLTLGAAIAAGSYLIDYGYIVVFGKPTKRVWKYLSIVVVVEFTSLSFKIGRERSAGITATVLLLLAVGRLIRGRFRPR